jgi:DNA segregation ATPase FtsK/SpoIIIE-like protein
LDAPGAEALLGRGDAILQSPVCDRVRFQSTYVDADEIVARS